MSSFSGYPAALRFVYNKLNAYTRNRVRQPVIAPDTATFNDTVIFELPANSKIDLSTLTVHFTAKTTATGGTTPSFMPPSYTNCLIDSLMVEVNGVQVCNIQQYAHLYWLLASYQAGDYSRYRGTLAELSYISSLPVSTVLTDVPLCIKNLLGFTSCNKVIDTGLTGPIRLSMKLVDKTAFMVSGSPTATTFDMKNISLQYDVINIDDGIYDSMLQQRLQNGGVISIPFTNYMAFMGTSGVTDNLTNRFSINTSSLDYIIHTVLPSNYNTSGSDAFTSGVNTSYYFTKGRSGITGCQLQIGSTYVPNYRHANAVECWSQTIDALGISGDAAGTCVDDLSATPSGAVASTDLIQTYTNSFFMFVAKLCHGQDNPYGERIVSGLNTTGANVMISPTTFGGSSTAFPVSWCVTTSMLNIGANRQLQYVA